MSAFQSNAFQANAFQTAAAVGDLILRPGRVLAFDIIRIAAVTGGESAPPPQLTGSVYGPKTMGGSAGGYRYMTGST